MNGPERNIVEFLKSRRGALIHYIRSRIRSNPFRDAEDILQDVLAGLLASGELETLENVLGYLYRSVRNRIIDMYRSNRGDARFESLAEESESHVMEQMFRSGGDVHDEMLRRDLREKIFSAIDSLKPEQRAVWVATELEGHSFQELSLQWGEPIGTLLSRKSRATKSLQRMLKREFEELSEKSD